MVCMSREGHISAYTGPYSQGLGKDVPPPPAGVHFFNKIKLKLNFSFACHFLVHSTPHPPRSVFFKYGPLPSEALTTGLISVGPNYCRQYSVFYHKTVAFRRLSLGGLVVQILQHDVSACRSGRNSISWYEVKRQHETTRHERTWHVTACHNKCHVMTRSVPSQHVPTRPFHDTTSWYVTSPHNTSRHFECKQNCHGFPIPLWCKLTTLTACRVLSSTRRKLGGNLPPRHDALLFSASGTGSFIWQVAPTRLDTSRPLFTQSWTLGEESASARCEVDSNRRPVCPQLTTLTTRSRAPPPPGEIEDDWTGLTRERDSD